jgi:hypothetical protein
VPAESSKLKVGSARRRLALPPWGALGLRSTRFRPRAYLKKLWWTAALTRRGLIAIG